MTHGPDPVYVLRGSQSTITYLKYLSNDVLYSGDQDGFIYIWDMKSNRQITKMTAHPGYSVLWIDFVNEDETMVTQGRDGIVQFWSKDCDQWTKSDKIKSAMFGYCACCLVDNLIAVPCDTVSIVELYELKSKQCSGQLQSDQSQKKHGMCMTIKAVGEKSWLLIGYENGSVALWDIKTCNVIDQINLHTESLMCLDYSSKLNLGISGSADDKLISWAIDDDCRIVYKNEIITKNPGFNQISIRKDQKIIAVAGWDSYVRIFSAKKLKPLAVLSYHKESVQCLTFSTDNKLSCGSKDHHISLWEIYP